MVNDQNQDTRRKPVNQAVYEVTREPNKIGTSAPYDFGARNLTAYGGMLRWPPCWRDSVSSNWRKKRSSSNGKPSSCRSIGSRWR